MHSALYAIARPSVSLSSHSDAFISPYGESMACRQRRRVLCSRHCSVMVRNVQGWYEKSVVRRVRKIHGTKHPWITNNISKSIKSLKYCCCHCSKVSKNRFDLVSTIEQTFGVFSDTIRDANGLCAISILTSFNNEKHVSVTFGQRLSNGQNYAIVCPNMTNLSRHSRTALYKCQYSSLQVSRVMLCKTLYQSGL